MTIGASRVHGVGALRDSELHGAHFVAVFMSQARTGDLHRGESDFNQWIEILPPEDAAADVVLAFDRTRTAIWTVSGEEDQFQLWEARIDGYLKAARAQQ